MFTVRRACRFWLNLRYKGSFQPLRVEVAARVPWFRRITRCLEEVLEGLGHGDTVLVHCKAGKHRSGAFSALVLACLTGVSWDTAAEDLFRIRKYNDKDRIIVGGIGKDLTLRDVADELRRSEFWHSIEYMFAASIERRRIQRLAGRAGAHVPPREKRLPVADKPLTSSSSTVVLELMSKKMPSNKQQPQPLPTPPPPPRRRTEKRAASMSPPRGPPQKRPLRSPERPPLRREGFDKVVLTRAMPRPPAKLTTAPAKPSSGVPSSLVLKHTTTPKSKSSGVPLVLRPPPVESAKSKSSGVAVVLRPPPVDEPVLIQDSDDSEDGNGFGFRGFATVSQTSAKIDCEEGPGCEVAVWEPFGSAATESITGRGCPPRRLLAVQQVLQPEPRRSSVLHALDVPAATGLGASVA